MSIALLMSEAESLKKLNPFLVLGVGYEASDSDVRAAFGELTKRYHPDRFARYESPELRNVAAEIFILIRDAYRKLSDEPNRAQARRQLWNELRSLRDEGLVRAIGVSNYDLDQIDDLISATGEAPAVNQVRWSPSRHDPAVLAGHQERGVVLEGYSPLKDSRLSDPVITGLAADHGVTAAQVVLRWHLEHGIPVIPKSENPERIAANLDLLGFSLSQDEVARIDALAR